MLYYCPKCDEMRNMSIQAIKETFSIKGEKVEIDSEVTICKICGEKAFNYELDDKNLKLAYSLYRKKHNLLSPSKITSIRKKYFLSQRALARLLEWGEITINRYENGALPDTAHNEVLTLISDPRNMRAIYERNVYLLPLNSREKLERTINALIRDEIKPQFINCLEDYILTKNKIDEYSGFNKFELDKMFQMILFIVDKSSGVFTTKLNKLLWYCDFWHFNLFKKSISGSHYVHLPLGPVPDDYKWIIAAAINDKLLNEEEIVFSSGDVGTKYRALMSSDIYSFNDEEIKTINFIIEYFRDFSCIKIKDKSHSERAYSETRPQDKISYKYAEFISLD